MKRLALLSIWLISALFGCGGRTSKKPKQDLPWFPETDNAAIQMMEIPLDSGYMIQAFLVAPERKEVFALAHNRVFINPKKGVDERWQTDYLLLQLDVNGTLLNKKNLPGLMQDNLASLWFEHSNLVFFKNDEVLVYDAATLNQVEKIPCYKPGRFPGPKNLKELFPEEQLPLYLPAREKCLQHSMANHVLGLPNDGGCVLLIQESKTKRSIWEIQDSTEVDDFTRKYGLWEVPGNPSWHYDSETGMFEVQDKDIHLRTTAKVSMGTQLDYPNYKERFAIQYALELQGELGQFATNNRSRKPLYVQISENDYLSAGGKEVWIAYNGALYRMFLTQSN